MKKILGLMLAAFMLVSCASPKSISEPMPSNSAQPTQTPSISPEQEEQAEMATPTPTAEPTAVPSTPAPEPPDKTESTLIPVTDSAVQEPVTATPEPVAAADGAIPFHLAANTGKWWYIDSTDSAYQATADGINAIRADAGLPALALDDSLSTAASNRCESFVAGGPFDHSGMTTRSEICARGPIGSAAAVCEAWKNSPAHYANIVNPEFTAMGVSCWFCEEDGKQYTYWVVTFG